MTATRWTKRDIIEQYGIPAQQDRRDPARPRGSPRPSRPTSRSARFRRRSGSPERFAFYPAMTFPHKNHLRLFEALAILRDRHGIISAAGLHRQAVRAVLAGRSRGGGDGIGSTGRSAARRRPRRDARRDLQGRPRCLVFPSFFEGLGLPILEALSTDCPSSPQTRPACPRWPATPRSTSTAARVSRSSRRCSPPSASLTCSSDAERPAPAALARFSWPKAAATFVACYRAVAGAPLSPEQRALYAEAIDRDRSPDSQPVGEPPPQRPPVAGEGGGAALRRRRHLQPSRQPEALHRQRLRPDVHADRPLRHRAGSTDGTIEYLQSVASDRLIPILVGERLGRRAPTTTSSRSCRRRTSPGSPTTTRSSTAAWTSPSRSWTSCPGSGWSALKVKDVEGPAVSRRTWAPVSSIGVLNVNQGMLRTSVLQAVGGFSERFRDYGIDPDLTAKVLFSGWDVAYTRAVGIHHSRAWAADGSASSAAQRGRQQGYVTLYASKWASTPRPTCLEGSATGLARLSKGHRPTAQLVAQGPRAQQPRLVQRPDRPLHQPARPDSDPRHEPFHLLQRAPRSRRSLPPDPA